MLYMVRMTVAEPNCCPWKIGRWRGTLAKLRSRYITAYGPDLVLRHFPCSPGYSVPLEAAVFSTLAPHRLYRRCELFQASPDLGTLYINTLELATNDPVAFIQDRLSALQTTNTSDPCEPKPVDIAFLRWWGIDRVDSAFIDAIGNKKGRPECKATLLLEHCLVNGSHVHANRSHKKLCKRAAVLLQTADALGLRSLLDDQTVIPDLSSVFRDKLISTPMFRDYANSSRLFRNISSDVHDWTLNSIVKALNMMLSSIGLKLICSVFRRRSRGVRVKTCHNYSLDPALVDKMVELLKLRMRRSNSVSTDPIARAKLDACQLPRWGHLCGPDRTNI
jgi:hypothetical protein